MSGGLHPGVSGGVHPGGGHGVHGEQYQQWLRLPAAGVR